ncbi:MAG TPA: hypothetical protein VFZ62_00240 [Candidatus Saccharimonadales bacterium]
MEPFKEILAAGGHANSLGRSGEVLEAVRTDNTKMDELFECISHEDAWVRMRAIDTFEKLVNEKPELAGPYLDAIFTKLTKSDQPSIQWHLAQIFNEVTLNDDQQKQAVLWLKQRIKTTDVDWIVSANTMKTLLSFCKKGIVSDDELRPLFETQTAHDSKSIRKKATGFLQELKSA